MNYSKVLVVKSVLVSLPTFHHYGLTDACNLREIYAWYFVVCGYSWQLSYWLGTVVTTRGREAGGEASLGLYSCTVATVQVCTCVTAQFKNVFTQTRSIHKLTTYGVVLTVCNKDKKFNLRASIWLINCIRAHKSSVPPPFRRVTKTSSHRAPGAGRPGRVCQ